MAVILNMKPAEPQQNFVLQNANKKDGTKSGNSEVNFAKALNIETDKSGMDIDSKLTSNDTMQLMAAMTGMAVPVVVNLNLVEKNICNSSDSLGRTAHDTPQVQLANAVPVVPQIQLANAVSVASQSQLANAVPIVPQSQLAIAIPVVQQSQLANAVPIVPQIQLASAIPVVQQSQLANAVPALPQSQLANTVPVVPQIQLTNAVPVVPPAQLVDAAPPAQQFQLGNTASIVLQSQLANAVPRDTIGLATLLPQRAVMNTQVDNTQLRQFVELQVQTQLQQQNKPIIGQVGEKGVSIKNPEMLANDPVQSNIITSLNDVGNVTVLSKNSNKQIEGKKMVVGQTNVEATEVANIFGLADALDVKPVLAPQVAAAVVDRLSSENKEILDVSLPNQIIKNPDNFANMLHQQGMKIENQISVEVKQEPSQQVSDFHNITSQIIEQARFATGTKNTEMIIKLKPEHLGELTFKVTVENGMVSASFHSNNAEVRSIIESSLSQLKHDLSNQGLKIDNVGVYAGLGQFFSNDQQSSAYQQPVIKVQNKKSEEDFLEVFEATDAADRILDVTGVDYRA